MTMRQPARVDHLLIAEMVAPGSRVLDVGCGNGDLLMLLEERRGVDARGIELRQAKVNDGVARGLSIIQGDAETDLTHYPDHAFDYAILSQTLPAMKEPHETLIQLVRIGRRAIVSFPNFGYWRIRWRLLWGGRMPVTPTLPEPWFRTPNIHSCTIRDFLDLCRELGIVVERAQALNAYGRPRRISLTAGWQNLLGEQAVFLLRGSVAQSAAAAPTRPAADAAAPARPAAHAPALSPRGR